MKSVGDWNRAGASYVAYRVGGACATVPANCGLSIECCERNARIPWDPGLPAKRSRQRTYKALDAAHPPGRARLDREAMGPSRHIHRTKYLASSHKARGETATLLNLNDQLHLRPTRRCRVSDDNEPELAYFSSALELARHSAISVVPSDPSPTSKRNLVAHCS